MAAQKTIIVISSGSESASNSPAPPVITLSSDSERTSNSPAPPAPQPEYVELPDEPEDPEGVFGKLWDHHYKSLRRIYMHAQMVKRTGTDTLKQNATVYLAHMVQLERVRVQLNKALNAYSKASTSAEILERWRELRRLNDEYTAAIEAQDPRNWIIPRYRRLYSTHIQQWCYSTLMCHTMEWMVTDAASTNTNDKYILDIMGLKETTQLPASPCKPSPDDTKLPLDVFVERATALEPAVTHLGIEDYLEVLCYFVEELRRRLDEVTDPQSNQAKGLRQLGLDVAEVFIQHTKPTKRRWVVIWDRVHRALGKDMAPGVGA